MAAAHGSPADTGLHTIRFTHATACPPMPPLCRPDAGFGVPNRRKRVFVLASLHGDARDVLLAQVGTGCTNSTRCAIPRMLLLPLLLSAKPPICVAVRQLQCRQHQPLQHAAPHLTALFLLPRLPSRLPQGAQKCVAGSSCAVGSDCYECYSPEDRLGPGGSDEHHLMNTSYCLVFGNAQ